MLNLIITKNNIRSSPERSLKVDSVQGEKVRPVIHDRLVQSQELYFLRYATSECQNTAAGAAEAATSQDDRGREENVYFGMYHFLEAGCGRY